MRFRALEGKTLTAVVNLGDELRFEAHPGEVYRLFHRQDCCEAVTIEDICGDLEDLVGAPLLGVEEVISRENPWGFEDRGYESFTWTFYKMRTAKGSVTIRWYGGSNGCYSESVYFEQMV